MYGLNEIAVTPTPTGFVAVFNEPFQAALINLYDYSTTGGPDDVLLTSASGPQISYRGSLLIDPTDTTITFVKTSDFNGQNFNPSTGILPAGTYTVTLRSASNGFVDKLGNLLDGNDDGSTGDNYVGTFVLASASAGVGVPAFARGPDNGVELPNDLSSTVTATTNGIPLNVNNAGGATSGQFTLTFDPSLLNVTAFVANNTQKVVFSGATSGTFTLTFSNGLTTSTTAAISYSTDLGTLQANIQNALDALANVGGGGCVVGVSSDLSAAVTFTGALGMGTYATMQVSGSLNIGATVSVTSATLPPGMRFSLDSDSELANGIAIVDFTSVTPLPIGALRLGSFSALVPGNAPYSAASLLHFSSSALSGINGAIAVASADAVQVVAYLGDTNGDQAISPGDETEIDRVALATDQNATTGTLGGFSGYLLIDPSIIGDLNSNGNVDSADYSLIMAWMVGITHYQLPPPY